MNVSTDVVIRYIKMKNKTRKIVTYKSDDCELKAYHRKVARFLNDVFINSIFAKAYSKNQSIYENGKAHMYNDYFIMLDVADYFHSINHKTLVSKLYLEGNRLNVDNITYKECVEIVKNCSVNEKGIPLGFITSPILSNIYLKEFDGILYGVLKKLGLNNVIYTRYADDICISFKECDNCAKEEKRIIRTVDSLLKRYHLKLNTKKTRSYNFAVTNHIKITGVNIVKDSLNFRKLTIGKKVKNNLFWDAVKCYNRADTTSEEIQKIKGMQSFVLSIEKRGYEEGFSENMMKQVYDLGFDSLKDLIDNLSNKY